MRLAAKSDLPGILGVQRDGFMRVADAYEIPHEALPPLRETVADLESLYDAGTRFFIAIDAVGHAIGTVRALDTAGTVEIGRLAVAGGWVRRGVAASLMEALEGEYPHAERYTLFTGADAAAPLALYRKLGYTQTRREDMGSVELVWLEKAGRLR